MDRLAKITTGAITAKLKENGVIADIFKSKEGYYTCQLWHVKREMSVRAAGMSPRSALFAAILEMIRVL